MDRLTSVAVGVDFSGGSRVALAQAIRVARWNEATLHLLHVIDTDTVDDLHGAVNGDRAALEADLKAEAEKAVRELVTDAVGLTTEVHVSVARPAKGMLAFCHDHSPDLLVLGIRGHNTRERRAGTQSRRVAKHAPVKTLLVHESAVDRFEHVTVCTDFSKHSDDALVQGVRIARQDHATLDLMHVFTPPWRVLHYRGPTVGSDPDFQAQYRAGLTGRMHGVIERLAGGYPVETVLAEHGNHADGILQQAEALGSDLLIIGNRGKTGAIERFFVGGTAERVLDEADCSVLVVHVR